MSPSAPRTEEGLYWGYSVRLASSFGAMFTQSPYREGYDITIGTSERGTLVDDLELPNFRYSTKNVTDNFQIKLCILIFPSTVYVMLAPRITIFSKLSKSAVILNSKPN